MNAILLAAGYGTRLRPMTNKIPKCLVKINQIPIIERCINKLEEASIEKVLINTHYLNDKVRNYLKKKKFKIKIKITYEKKLLGTAGTLLKNLNFYENYDGLLLHADNYFDESLVNLINYHKKRPQNCLITALTFKTENPSSCGIFKINSKKIVKEFYEKPKKKKLGNLANAATYILSSRFLNMLNSKFNKAKSFSDDILPSLKDSIYTFETKKNFIDIGSLKNYRLANKYAKRQDTPKF